MRVLIPHFLPSAFSHLHNYLQVAWSTATVHGTPLLKLLSITPSEQTAIATSVRQKADTIIAIKGFTSYGIAAVTSRICEAILFDHRQVMPLSHWQEKLKCCLSLPAVVGRQGVVGEFPLCLNAEEMAFLEGSAASLRMVIDGYGDDKRGQGAE
jgi:L-lactate dehydrogenase